MNNFDKIRKKASFYGFCVAWWLRMLFRISRVKLMYNYIMIMVIVIRKCNGGWIKELERRSLYEGTFIREWI